MECHRCFSYDFGGLLNDYTILTVARHTGQNNAVIASVGSDWAFGLEAKIRLLKIG